MDPEITDRPAAAPGADHSETPDVEPAGLAVQARMAALIAESLADADWHGGTLFWSAIGSTAIGRLTTLDLSGHAREHRVPDGLDALGRELRETMTTPEKGAWLSMTLQLGRDGSFVSRFNFDRRVYDNPATPFAAGELGDVPSDDDYASDLREHPRSPRSLPAWLRPAFEAPAPYDVLADAWGWPGVFRSVDRQAAIALDQHEPAGPVARELLEGVGRRVLRAVVADVLEPHRVATLLGLHAEAVSRRLLPAVDGTAALDSDQSLLEAREASSPALLAVEAGVYGIIGDLVRARLAPAVA